MSQFSTDIIINANNKEVWSVLSDIGAIASWNPGVKESYATSGQPEGPGATRFCDLGGKNYLNEEVVQWEYCEKLTMRVTESNMPFKSADIHFTLEDMGNQTKVTVAPDYQLKYGLAGLLMDRFYVRATYEKGMRNLLRGLKKHVEQNGADKADKFAENVQPETNDQSVLAVN